MFIKVVPKLYGEEASITAGHVLSGCPDWNISILLMTRFLVDFCFIINIIIIFEPNS